MKRTSLVILSILLLFAGGVVSQVPDEVHEKCKDARDYVGCIQVLTGATISKEEVEIEEIKNLKKALALLPSRLENTVLRDFSMAIQPFTDALASARAAAGAASDYSLEDKTKILELTNPSLRLSAAIDIFRTTWSNGIENDAGESHGGSSKWVRCDSYDYLIDGFNDMFDSNVLSYHSIHSRAFDFSKIAKAGLGNIYVPSALGRLDTCYLNEDNSSVIATGLRALAYPSTEGRPIYRSYEGQMLYYIIDASEGILIKGSFPTYPLPRKSLSELKSNYIEKFQKEIKDDIAKFRELHKLENNPWIATNEIVDWSKKDFQKRNKIGLFDFSKLKGRNQAVQAIKDLYAYDFSKYDQRVCKRKNYLCHTEKIMKLVGVSVYVAKQLASSDYGIKEDNIKEARELVIGALSLGFESCQDCYNDRGVPTQWFLDIKRSRSLAHETLKEFDDLLSASNSQP